MRRQLRAALTVAVAFAAGVLQGCASDAAMPLSPAGAPSFTGSTNVTVKAKKTATPFWNQSKTFDWEIQKTVTPTSVVLQQGETADFNFVITATRSEVGSTSAYGMTGTVCVDNTGAEATDGLRITDRVFEVVGGVFTEVASFDIDVSVNPELDPGESQCYSYSVELPAGFAPNPAVTYNNKAYIFSDGLAENGSTVPVRIAETIVAVAWPDSPVLVDSLDASATVVDVVSCPAGFACTPSGSEWNFGTTTAQPFTVSLKNNSATCGSEFEIINTADLTEDDSGVVRGPATATGLIATQECLPPPSTQGCTPGYWKQKQHFDSWVGFTTGQNYDSVFGVNVFSPDRSLLQALSSGGGGINRLGRHSVAALLNTANGGVEYGMTTAQVIALVQQAVASGDYDMAADQFESLNERGCPLN